MDARDIAAGRERWQARYDAARTRDAGNETFHNAQGEVKSVRGGFARKFVKFFTN